MPPTPTPQHYSPDLAESLLIETLEFKQYFRNAQQREFHHAFVAAAYEVLFAPKKKG